MFLLICSEDPEVSCPEAWRSKRQGATASSTGEAEIVAVSEALKQAGLPCQSTLQEWFKDVHLIVFGDAVVSERCVLSGWSKAMKYLRKHQRVSLSQLKEMFDRSDITYQHIESSRNPSDMMTKALDRQLHEQHCKTTGIHLYPI